MNIHLFASFFGVAASWTFGFYQHNEEQSKREKYGEDDAWDADNRGSYVTDIFSFLGSFLLFIFFPRYLLFVIFVYLFGFDLSFSNFFVNSFCSVSMLLSLPMVLNSE